MSKQSKENFKTQQSIEENNEKDADTEKKNKLLMEIRTLKLLIKQTESTLRIPTKFKDLQNGMRRSQLIPMAGGTSQLIDVDSTFKKNLCVYAGFCCEKMDEEFVFSFPSCNEKILKKKSCVQLFKDEERWRLGCWTMPLGIDVQAIFAKYSMDSHNDIKYFLRECKHLLECQNRREHEFKMLQSFISHMRRYGCSVEADIRYTVTTMKLLMKRNSSLDMKRNILVYLISKKDGVTPTKIKIDSEDDNELSDDCRKKLRQFLNCFKEMSLINAASCTLESPDSPFFWKDASKDDSIIEVNSEEPDDMNTSSLLQLLQKKSRAPKKRRRDSIEVNESLNKKRKNDLSSEIIEDSDPEVCEDETSPVSNRKSKKPKNATTKDTKPATRNFAAKKTNIGKRGKVEIGTSAYEKGENNSSTPINDEQDLEICEIETIQVESRNEKPKRSIAQKTNPVEKKSIAKKTNGLTIDNQKNVPVVELSEMTSHAPAKEFSPLKDCNDNFESSNLKKKSRKTAEKSTKNNNEVQATLPHFFKLQRPLSNPAPAETNDNPSTHSVKPKLAGPKFFHLQRQRSNAPSTNINGNSVTTPKARSINRLLSSTPICESTALSAIAEENISAIVKDNTIAPEVLNGSKKNETAINRSIILDSDESDENDIEEIVNNQTALLKDLQDIKYNNDALNKVAIKSVKHIKYPSRGRKKISKK